ncbi:MAG: asparagine synthase (glutamine-hydrolyzing) [Planctomycetes bacterium]|nr:asparagine synthase (glutamine-hydrolyzing) [Planctomycetota bacterium]
MCGIAGFFGAEVTDPACVDRMLAALRRRGPDAQHVRRFSQNFSRIQDERPAPNALIHARLSIIDPRPEADQPMVSDDGQVWLCYNGEVYDWQRHAEELKARGVQFRTRSDTEFILRGYLAWGVEALLPRLRGMFAFVIVDLRARQVHGVRDRMGLKPLVFSHGPHGFGFASTVRALLPWVPPARRALDQVALDAFLAHRYVPAPATIIEGIRRLEPAHRLQYDLRTGQLQRHRWWSPRDEVDRDPRDWHAVLDEAVRIRTVADRPVGVFLSGGIDSSTVAARLAALGHRDLTTFTAGFEDPRFDESATAARIASTLGVPNRRVSIPASIASDFDSIIEDLDEPFADPSAFPMWYLSRETTKHVKVVLGGDGGDELFAGYKRVARHLRSRWRGALRLPLPIVPAPSGRGWRKWCDRMRMGWLDSYAIAFSGMTPGQRLFLQPDGAKISTHAWRMPELQGLDARERLLEIDLANYLPEYILRKGDLCTMAHGLELRLPLLDHRWVGRVRALSRAERFTNPPKGLLVSAAPELRSLDLLHAPKRGFNPPLRTWLQQDLHQRVDCMGPQLEALTAGRVRGGRVQAMVQASASDARLDESILSLVVLATSLHQLAGLR